MLTGKFAGETSMLTLPAGANLTLTLQASNANPSQTEFTVLYKLSVIKDVTASGDSETDTVTFSGTLGYRPEGVVGKRRAGNGHRQKALGRHDHHLCRWQFHRQNYGACARRRRRACSEAQLGKSAEQYAAFRRTPEASQPEKAQADNGADHYAGCKKTDS